MSHPGHMIDRLARRAGTTNGIIQRPTITSDGANTPVKVWVTVESGVPLFLDVTSGVESIMYGGERNRRTTKAYMPPGTDIQEEDRLVVSGSYYDVQHVDTPGNMLASDRMSLVVVDLQETLPDPV